MIYKNNEEIAILLATYNSSNFLEEQLESIANQSNINWHIYAHDDGSTDNTVNILENFKYSTGKLTILFDDKKKLGATHNFIHIINHVQSRYYMFCDHDDVWLPKKIDRAIDALKEEEKENPEKPIIVHTDLILVDKDLNIISNSMWNYAKIRPSLLKQKEFGLVSSFVTGCTMCINDLAKYEYTANIPKDNVYFHDTWIALQAIYRENGIIVSLKDADILYRLHGNNESGIPEIGMKYYFNRLSNVIRIFKEINKKRPYLDYFNYGSLMKFLYYKSVYNIKRNKQSY